MFFSPAVLLFSVTGTIILFALWLALRVLLQHRRIKNSCLSVWGSLSSLRHAAGAEFAAELADVDRASFAAVRGAFMSYIRPNMKYRDNLLCALNAICGTSYTVMDMYDCFDNGRLNQFFRDIVGRSGYLFINMLYLAQLENNGFRPVDVTGIERYL